MRIIYNLEEWAKNLNMKHSITYTASVEIKHPDKSVTSITNGSVVCIQMKVLKTLHTHVCATADQLLCKRSCSCLLDLILQ